MRNRFLILIVVLVAISLIGVVSTQTFWLKKTIAVSEKQFDDRADRMLEDVLEEIKQYVDTAEFIHQIPKKELKIFDVIDTSLLANLLLKYITYHRLDNEYSYGLVRTEDDSILYHALGFTAKNEVAAYKACLSCIWKKEYIHLSVFFPNKNKNLFSQISIWIILSVIFLLVITSAFTFIIFSIFRQKKISEIKNDFINNMTHEFKTPISTISLASEMLMKSTKNLSGKKVLKYSKIIFDENQRMQSQVELVLQTALIDRGQLRLKREITDLHELLRTTIDSFCLESCEKDAEFIYELKAVKSLIEIDPIHIRNVIGNIIDNAIKYSKIKPQIRISTENIDNGLQVAITDNGIGISRDVQKRVFDKFYRVSTGNLHDVKGFGLGLYYVKTIIEAHAGKVDVQSSLNNGSTFYVFLPA
jgi:two-component system, OmpR family, phosphate regulon sensor histidine kinase PhoR